MSSCPAPPPPSFYSNVSLLAATTLAAQCPPQGDPFFLIPHETDCSKFYICANGQPELQTCPDGTHFSPMHLVCQNPVFAGCDTSLPPLCPDWSLIQRPHPESCSKFIVCQYGTVHEIDCPAGLEFSAEQLECVWPSESNCSISPPQPEDSQEDGSQDGSCQEGDRTPHEECSKYYVCDQREKVAMDCPPGLHWDAKELTCAWPALAGCQ